MSTTNKITDIHCPSCGAPASYDIRKGIYARQHCGGKLTGTIPPVRNITPPVFFKTLNGKREEVVLRFSSPLRIAGMILTALVVLFLRFWSHFL